MIKNNRALLFLCLLCVLFQCKDPALEELDFFTVHTLQPVYLSKSLGTIILRGEADSLGSVELTERGFLLDTSLSAVQAGIAQIFKSNNIDTDDDFRDTISGLNLEQVYYYRAYAHGRKNDTHRKIMASEIIPFSFSVVLHCNLQSVQNDNIIVESRITGLSTGDKNIQVDHYGHIYSAVNADPRMESDTTFTLLEGKLGALFDDKLFLDTLMDLSFNTEYYVRSYAMTQDTVYYSKVIIVQVVDGWEQVNSFDYGITHTAYGVIGNKGYFVLGCDDLNCINQNINKKIFEFSPGPLSSWSELSAPDININVYNATSFVIDNDFYVAFGIDLNNPSAKIRKKSIDLPSSNWDVIAPKGINNVSGRQGAIAFVINNKAYFGTGVKDASTYFSDFWEYNPVDDTVRQVASLPFIDVNSNQVYVGRADAVAFTINGECFAGGGQLGGSTRSDFWKFTPPTDTNPMDTGKWQFHSHFPGDSRADAVVMVLKDKVYYGSGRNFLKGFLNDFWEFDPSKPQSDAWKQVAQFPGKPRARALSFAIQEKGYFGLGDRIFPSTTGNFINEVFPDFWQYTPPE